MAVALIAAILGGGIIGLALSLRIVRRVAATADSSLVYRAASIGAGSIAVPAFFVAIVFGGNLGGGAGAALGARFGNESLGASVGLTIGLALVLAVGLIVGASVGALVGRVLAVTQRGP